MLYCSYHIATAVVEAVAAMKAGFAADKVVDMTVFDCCMDLHCAAVVVAGMDLHCVVVAVGTFVVAADVAVVPVAAVVGGFVVAVDFAVFVTVVAVVGLEVAEFVVAMLIEQVLWLC